MKRNIVVLGGGDSPERDISLRSARGVINALKSLGYDPTFYDPAEGLGFLDSLERTTIVLPVLHGVGGEDGILQRELEKRNVRFLGSDSIASRLCFDKAQTREVLLKNDVPVPQGQAVDKNEYRISELAKKPHILKVARGGSSIGTLFVKDPAMVDELGVDEVFSLDDKAILEELVQGIEITVPILGDAALPVIEIRPPADEDFDFANKYNGATQELCPPTSINENTQHEVRRLAERVHEVTGCRHLSRVDIIVRPDGSPVVLEINTIPGMTSESLFPKSAAVAGLSMQDLVKRFIEMAEEEIK